MPALEVSGISKTLGSFHLSKISFRAEKGEVFGTLAMLKLSVRVFRFYAFVYAKPQWREVFRNAIRPRGA
ncbi:MAG: hypothetical protein GXO67_06790 [Archaeoglobi archaeon]|nr:hypothetical protein [Archaeoglobi archaeon]